MPCAVRCLVLRYRYHSTQLYLRNPAQRVYTEYPNGGKRQKPTKITQDPLIISTRPRPRSDHHFHSTSAKIRSSFLLDLGQDPIIISTRPRPRSDHHFHSTSAKTRSSFPLDLGQDPIIISARPRPRSDHHSHTTSAKLPLETSRWIRLELNHWRHDDISHATWHYPTTPHPPGHLANMPVISCMSANESSVNDGGRLNVWLPVACVQLFHNRHAPNFGFFNVAFHLTPYQTCAVRIGQTG